MSLQPGGDGSWLVPVEMALSCSCSAFKDLVLKRIARGDYPRPAAKAFKRGERWFTVIDFPGERHPALLMPLDLWTLEGAIEPRNLLRDGRAPVA